MRRRDSLGELSVDGRIILKWILDWMGFFWRGIP
jgi:hypothetical protein